MAAFHSQPSGDSRGGEALTDRMDNGEYISTVDNMDTTLAELGDEFTLRDIDGELDICSMCFIKLTVGPLPITVITTQLSRCWAVVYVTSASVTKFGITSIHFIAAFKNRRRFAYST